MGTEFSARTYAPVAPVALEDRLALARGDRLRLGGGTHIRLWWTVQALDDARAVMTRRAPFKNADQVQYTILDWTLGQVGPCDLIGNGWSIDAADPVPGCERLLAALRSFGEDAVGLSVRRSVALRVLERRPAAAVSA